MLDLLKELENVIAALDQAFARTNRMKVDMSAKAITERLRLVSELTKLCVALGKARPLKLDSTRSPSRPSPGTNR